MPSMIGRKKAAGLRSSSFSSSIELSEPVLDSSLLEIGSSTGHNVSKMAIVASDSTATDFSDLRGIVMEVVRVENSFIVLVRAFFF